MKMTGWTGALVLLLGVRLSGAAVDLYTEQYGVFADGSTYINSLDNQSEQECADACTEDLQCKSFEWRDPAAVTGPTGNCNLSEFDEGQGPGLSDSDTELWNFYEANAVECPEYPAMAGATVVTTGNAKGDTAIVTCDAGYVGGGTSYCLGTGQHDQRYACLGTSLATAVAGSDCTWRTEDSESPGTFELGNLGVVPTYWLEEEWYPQYCWVGVGVIGSVALTLDDCKLLCDGDGSCTGATHDGTNCQYWSGDGELTSCGAPNYGYQRLTADMDAIGTTEFSHCGDKGLGFSATDVTTSSEWVLAGCYDQSSYFTGASSTPPADTPANIFAAAEAQPFRYVAFAYVGGNSGDVNSRVQLFNVLVHSAVDSSAAACEVSCLDDPSYFCGDEASTDDDGVGGWAVYVHQPQGTAMSVISDGVTNPSTFSIFAGQSYLVHYWAFIQQTNSTAYPVGSLSIDTTISDIGHTYEDVDSNDLLSAFEWIPLWHSMFSPPSDTTDVTITIGSRQQSTLSTVFVDDVIVYCVSCCYPDPDFFLPDRMYYEEDTGTLGRLDTQSAFWDADVSSTYTTAVTDTYVTQVCGSASISDSTALARMGLALSYRAEDHSIIGGEFALELGADGVAFAYNSEAEPSCGCYAVDMGVNAGGGSYKVTQTLVHAPAGTWTYGVYAKVTHDWDGPESLLQAQWFDIDDNTLATTSTGPWVEVNNLPVYDEYVYATKTVTISSSPVRAEIFLGAAGSNTVGSLEVFSLELIGPDGHDWLEGTGKSDCGADFEKLEVITGVAAVISVTCEEFMSPFWTEYALEGVSNNLDIVLYGTGDEGCISFVPSNTWTQSSEYTGNSWDFYSSCEDFCTAAGSTCAAARYQATETAVTCLLGPVPEVLECQCTDSLIVYSVTTNDGFDVSLNVGTTDDQLVTGGTNSDGSFDVASDELCLVQCRDEATCLMFEFFEPSNCMMYRSNLDVVVEECLGKFEWSSRSTGHCDGTATFTYDSSSPPNDAIFDAMDEELTDNGFTTSTRTFSDTICQALCEEQGLACLGYAVADDVLFGSDIYTCVLYDSCDSPIVSSDKEYYTKDFSLSFLPIGNGLACDNGDSTDAGTGLTIEECAFQCLLDSHCQTFSWADGQNCRFSNTAVQCTAVSSSGLVLYFLTECVFSEKGSSTETDVFHAVAPSATSFFGTVAPFNFESTLTGVATRTAWETCDEGELVSVASDVTATSVCGGTWSTNLASGAVTEIALCYDAAVGDAGGAGFVQMVVYGDDGSCYYSTDAASVVADASGCTWTMTTAVVLTTGLNIQYAPDGSAVTTQWDGTCVEEGADEALHSTCTGPAGCRSGWEGVLCATDIDDCASFPCESHLECFDTGTNSFECRCVGGWGALCTQPMGAGNRAALAHAKYCWVATDAICTAVEQEYVFTGEVTSLNVCKNYCTAADFCTHLAWVTSTGECTLYSSTSDGCATQAFQSDTVMFEPCGDGTERQTAGYRYLEIGSRGAVIANSNSREQFETINLL